MWHIIERALLHFFLSGSLVLAVYFVLAWLGRRWSSVWIPSSRESKLLVASLVVFGASTLREPFDVLAGQTGTKVVTDFLSWALGVTAAAVGLHRFEKRG